MHRCSRSVITCPYHLHFVAMTFKATLWLLLLGAGMAGAHAQYPEHLPFSSKNTIPVSDSTYDYIVVGGGASGLIVSERLAETGKSILVLEWGAPSLFSSGGTALTSGNNT